MNVGGGKGGLCDTGGGVIIISLRETAGQDRQKEMQVKIEVEQEKKKAREIRQKAQSG